jgi:hypothetical protein
VPETCWYSNLRSELSKDQWDRVRSRCYRKAHDRCEVCGGRGRRWPVECHEIWHYNDTTHVQKLMGTIALCPACHEVKHIGHAGIRGRQAQALNHLARVNGWTVAEARKYMHSCFTRWSGRSEFQWGLDLDWLTESFGIQPKPGSSDRQPLGNRARSRTGS